MVLQAFCHKDFLFCGIFDNYQVKGKQALKRFIIVSAEDLFIRDDGK